VHKSKLKVMFLLVCSLLFLAPSAPAEASDLVSQARQYIGTNPTGWSNRWCGKFLDMLLKQTGRKGGGNLARGYVSYGPRVHGPQVGAIAVMNHHVGVVSGIDANGNPIIISGNTWGGGTRRSTVREAPISRGRVHAYVLPQ
jgi:uncharacterized protein (TIGR02594 family)